MVLRATAPADEELRLAVTGVQIKSGGSWFTLAKDTDIKASYPKAIRAGAKGIAVLLAKNVKVPKRKYDSLQLLLDNGNSMLLTSDGNQPLLLKNTQFALKDWQPDEKKPWNVLVVTLDGTKVTLEQSKVRVARRGHRRTNRRSERRDHRKTGAGVACLTYRFGATVKSRWAPMCRPRRMAPSPLKICPMARIP